MAREYSNKRSSRSRGGAPHLLVITVIFLLGYLAASFFDFETVSHWVNTQVLAYHEMKKVPAKPETPKQAVNPPKPKFEFYTLLANEKTAGSQPNNHAATQPATANANPVTTVQPTTANTNTAPTAMTVTAKATVPALGANMVAAASTTATSAQVRLNATRQQPVPQNTAMSAKLASASAAAVKGNFLVQVASFKARQDAEHMKGNLILKGFSVYIIPVSHPIKGNWFRVVVGPYANRGLAQQAQVTLARNERLNGMITTGG